MLQINLIKDFIFETGEYFLNDNMEIETTNTDSKSIVGKYVDGCFSNYLDLYYVTTDSYIISNGKKVAKIVNNNICKLYDYKFIYGTISEDYKRYTCNLTSEELIIQISENEDAINLSNIDINLCLSDSDYFIKTDKLVPHISEYIVTKNGYLACNLKGKPILIGTVGKNSIVFNKFISSTNTNFITISKDNYLLISGKLVAKIIDNGDGTSILIDIKNSDNILAKVSTELLDLNRNFFDKDSLLRLQEQKSEICSIRKSVPIKESIKITNFALIPEIPKITSNVAPQSATTIRKKRRTLFNLFR